MLQKLRQWLSYMEQELVTKHASVLLLSRLKKRDEDLSRKGTDTA